MVSAMTEDCGEDECAAKNPDRNILYRRCTSINIKNSDRIEVFSGSQYSPSRPSSVYFSIIRVFMQRTLGVGSKQKKISRSRSSISK